MMGCPDCGALPADNHEVWCLSRPAAPPPQIRPELEDFSLHMEEKLKKNDHKKGWRELPVEALERLLKLELEEYYVARDFFGPEAARKELIDVANFCMMLWDRLGMLKDEGDKDVVYAK